MAKSYKVIAPGFFNGMMYSPTGKRRTLTVEKPFKKDEIPSWVEEIKATRSKATKPADVSSPDKMSFLDGDVSGSTVEKI